MEITCRALSGKSASGNIIFGIVDMKFIAGSHSHIKTGNRIEVVGISRLLNIHEILIRNVCCCFIACRNNPVLKYIKVFNRGSSIVSNCNHRPLVSSVIIKINKNSVSGSSNRNIGFRIGSIALNCGCRRTLTFRNNSYSYSICSSLGS